MATMAFMSSSPTDEAVAVSMTFAAAVTQPTLAEADQIQNCKATKQYC